MDHSSRVCNVPHGCITHEGLIELLRTALQHEPFRCAHCETQAPDIAYACTRWASSTRPLGMDHWMESDPSFSFEVTFELREHHVTLTQ